MSKDKITNKNDKEQNKPNANDKTNKKEKKEPKRTVKISKSIFKERVKTSQRFGAHKS